MDIIFATHKFEKICNNQRRLVREFGSEQAQIVNKRLDDLRAASCLADMRYLPGRCHELKGNRAGQLSLDLRHPYRLIFEPIDTPSKPDGGLDWNKVTAVRVIGIEDTHD